MTSAEIDRLLRYGAYDVLAEDGTSDTEAINFLEEDIDTILLRRTKRCVHETKDGNGFTFNKTSFKVSEDGTSTSDVADIDIDDPDFWNKFFKDRRSDKEEDKRGTNKSSIQSESPKSTESRSQTKTPKKRKSAKKTKRPNQRNGGKKISPPGSKSKILAKKVSTSEANPSRERLVSNELEHSLDASTPLAEYNTIAISTMSTPTALSTKALADTKSSRGNGQKVKPMHVSITPRKRSTRKKRAPAAIYEPTMSSSSAKSDRSKKRRSGWTEEDGC